MNSSRSNGRAPILLLAIFLASGGLLALVYPAGSGFNAVSEMRPQASLPGWPASLGAFRSWPKEFGWFVRDSFPGRSGLIELGRTALWKLGWLDSERVLEGEGGWLFLRRHQNTFEKSRGLLKPTSAEIVSWGHRYTDVERYLDSQGAQLWLAVIPDKQTAYPSRVPEWAQPVGRDSVTSTDLILQELARRGVNRVVDLRAPLREAAKQVDVFYPTDSHWNAAGAKVAAELLLPRMWGAADPVGHRLLNGLSVRDAGQLYRGDLARMLGVAAIPDEATTELVIPEPQASYPSDMTSIWGPSGRVEAAAPGARTGTLLILGDSFFDKLRPFLVELYERTVVVHHREVQVPAALVEREKPAVVLILIVERLIPVAGPLIR